MRHNLNRSSLTGGTYKITLSGGLGQGPDKDVKSCLIKPDSGNTGVVRVNIEASATWGGECSDEWLPIPVDNLNKIFFSSTQSDAIVYMLWRD